MGVRSDAWTGTRQDKAGGEFASRGLKSSRTPVAAGGVSPALAPTVLGLRTRTPSTGAPSQPHCHQATCPCPLLGPAPSSPGSWGDAGAPWGTRQAGDQQQWDARSSSVEGQALEPIGKRSRGGGWHPLADGGPAGSSARSAVSPGQGQEEARLRHRLLPRQTSIPEEALSAANASQQPPQSLRAWQDAPRLHLLQMDCIRGRTKHWRVFKEKLQSQPAGEAASPLWRHLAGDAAGSRLGPKTLRAAGRCPSALLSQPRLCCPTVVAGQEPFNGCWPEDNSSIFTKKCPAAKSGFAPAANEKIRLGFGFFFSCSKVSWKAGAGQALEQTLTSASCHGAEGVAWVLAHFAPHPWCRQFQAAAPGAKQLAEQTFFPPIPSRTWGKKGKYSLLHPS